MNSCDWLRVQILISPSFCLLVAHTSHRAFFSPQLQLQLQLLLFFFFVLFSDFFMSAPHVLVRCIRSLRYSSEIVLLKDYLRRLECDMWIMGYSYVDLISLHDIVTVRFSHRSQQIRQIRQIYFESVFRRSP